MTPIQVVVGFDFGKSATVALHRAIALAARAPFHVLHVVCVIDPHVPLPGIEATNGVDYRYAERVQQVLADKLERELGTAQVTGRLQFCVHARIGKPATELLAVARDVGAELIIVGSNGATGVERLLLGSVAEHVVREAGCTVEVARPTSYEHVELTAISEVEAHHTYVPPHRYSYEDHRAELRPADWPLY